MSWGNKLLIALIVFAGIMATMVTIAMKQNIDLVDKDYYQKELAYQDQIDKMKNVINDKAIKLKILKKEQMIELQFDNQINEGRIHLFRPSNASEDLHIPVSISESGVQHIPYETLSSGLWRIKIDWKQKNVDYYFESELNLP